MRKTKSCNSMFPGKGPTRVEDETFPSFKMLRNTMPYDEGDCNPLFGMAKKRLGSTECHDNVSCEALADSSSSCNSLTDSRPTECLPWRFKLPFRNMFPGQSGSLASSSPPWQVGFKEVERSLPPSPLDFGLHVQNAKITATEKRPLNGEHVSGQRKASAAGDTLGPLEQSMKFHHLSLGSNQIQVPRIHASRCLDPAPQGRLEDCSISECSRVLEEGICLYKFDKMPSFLVPVYPTNYQTFGDRKSSGAPGSSNRPTSSFYRAGSSSQNRKTQILSTDCKSEPTTYFPMHPHKYTGGRVSY